MSNSGLVFQVHDPQGAHRFHDQIVEFVGIGTATSERDRFTTIYAMAGRIGFDKSVIAGFFDLLGDLAKRLIPAECLPIAFHLGGAPVA